MNPYRQRIRPYRPRRTLRRLGLLRIPRGVWNNTAMYILKFNMLNHLTS